MAEQALYSSPPLKAREIRVLTIHPGDWAADIHCELSVVSLDSAPNYVALSYVWGGSLQDGTLYFGDQEQRIGRSLETALRYYRRAGWHMPLWADAICVNQSDIAERSSQVSIMDCIYSSAATVFVVLGSGIDLTADDYFQKVKGLQDFRFSTYGQEHSKTTFPPEWDKSDPKAASDDEETSVLFQFLEKAVRLKINDHLSDVPRWGIVSTAMEESQYPWQTLIQRLEDFTCEAWWTRVWTLQESVVGFEPILVYRTAAAPWALIIEAVDSIGAHITDCCTPYLDNEAPPRYASAVKRLLAHTNNIEKTRQVYAKIFLGTVVDQLTLTHLFPKTDFQDSATVGITTGSFNSHLLYRYLCMHNRREATDARDKVYALLSLTKLGNAQSFIYPDYSRKLEDVYITTAKMLIQESGSLDLLSAAGRFRSHSLPSWVPDWSIMNESVEDAIQISALSMYEASFGSKISFSFPEHDVSLLKLEGFIFDHVAVLGQTTVPDGISGGNTWQTIFQWMKIAHSHSPNTRWIEFCRTVCTGLIIWPKDQVFRRIGPEPLTREMIQSMSPWKEPVSGNLTRNMPPEQLIQRSIEEMKSYFWVWYVLLGQQAERGMKSMAPSPTMEDFVKITTSFRRFAVSSLGHIGIVPSNSEKDDCIIFFKGCRFPCMARPVAKLDGQEKRFKIIGDCYIDSFMDGQIMDRITKKPDDDCIEWESIIFC